MKKKHNNPTSALVKTSCLLLCFSAAGILVLLWAAQSTDSELAAKIRQFVGIEARTPTHAEPSALEPTPAPAQPIEVAAPNPLIIKSTKQEPRLENISFAEITRQRELWPRTLKLADTKRIPIRYQDQIYGYMEFTPDSQVKVRALEIPGEVLCSINGNDLSLAVKETNFKEWFQSNYGERYQLRALPDSTDQAVNTASAQLGTAETNSDFLQEMYTWCEQNYESSTLIIGKDTLVFKWQPSERASVDFNMEAREISRAYLLKRAAYGSNENYANCEIRSPATNKLLGSAAIFIPRL